MTVDASRAVKSVVYGGSSRSTTCPLSPTAVTTHYTKSMHESAAFTAINEVIDIFNSYIDVFQHFSLLIALISQSDNYMNRERKHIKYLKFG